MHRFPAPLLLAAIVAVSLPARAEFFNNSSGLVNPAQTITFDEVPLAPEDLVTTQFQTFGVTFTNAWANPDPLPYPNITGNRIGNFLPAQHPFTLVMNFEDTVGGIGFSMVTATGVTTFTALLNGVVVETATAPTSNSNPTNFYGFQNIAFNEVSLSVDAGALMIDNLQTAPVPEPGTWVLMLCGTLSVSRLAVRRKRVIRAHRELHAHDACRISLEGASA
jgi:hypothetical protein